MRITIPARPLALTALLLAASVPLGVSAERAEAPTPAVERLSIAGQLAPQPNRIVTGTLDPEKMQAIADAGIAHVVSLQPDAEHPDFDEAAHAERLGIHRHHYPISSADDLDRGAALWLDGLLSGIGDSDAVLHCASGNRVGAVIALRAAWVEGQSTEDAIAKGRRWGLTGLEESVRERLAGDG